MCTGNLCRSPMAEAIARHVFEGLDVEVASTGTWAMNGSPATPEVGQTLAEEGIGFPGHRSRPIELDELLSADAIVVMTSVHAREIAKLAPAVRDRILLAKEIAEIEPVPVASGATPGERLRALLQGRRPPYRRALDLDDPMGLPPSAYRRTYRDLSTAIGALREALGA